MAKPEWGIKRVCQTCGARFYDLTRDPIVCPKCGAQYTPEAFSRSRRQRPAAVEEKVARDPVVTDDPELGTEDEEEEEELIEDASELEESDSDVSDVIGHDDQDNEH